MMVSAIFAIAAFLLVFALPKRVNTWGGKPGAGKPESGKPGSGAPDSSEQESGRPAAAELVATGTPAPVGRHAGANKAVGDLGDSTHPDSKHAANVAPDASTRPDGDGAVAGHGVHVSNDAAADQGAHTGRGAHRAATDPGAPTPTGVTGR
jgi:hypothetical protein